MPRINIDDKFFTDRRIDNLAKLMHSSRAEAESELLRLWHFCSCSVRTTFERPSVDTQSTIEGFSERLIKCQLADDLGNGTIKIRGVEKRIKYLKQASEAGKRSADARSKKFGSSQPSKVARTRVERTFEAPRTSSSSSSSSSSSCSKEDIYTLALRAVNEALGKSFRAVPANLKFIQARLTEGSTVQELVDVAKCKRFDWQDDPKMQKYLRIETLYGATKFQSYLAEAIDAKRKMDMYSEFA